jgi:hypothetical protein
LRNKSQASDELEIDMHPAVTRLAPMQAARFKLERSWDSWDSNLSTTGKEHPYTLMQHAKSDYDKQPEVILDKSIQTCA